MLRSTPARGAEKDCGEHHGGDDGHGIGLEQVGGHAGAIADIVADIVSDGCGIARIIFGNTGLDLAYEIAADIGALGEDPAPKTGEDGDQRGAESERHQGIDDSAVVGRHVPRPDKETEIERYAKQCEARHQQSGYGAGSECKLKPVCQRADRRLRGADIGAHRNIHSYEAGRAREDRTDQKSNRNQPAEKISNDQKDHDPDDTDGRILALQIGLRALAHGR